MWKKVMAFILILVLCVSVLWFANPLTPALKVSADTYRSGFSIVPEKEDETGVSLDSGFILSSQTEVTQDYLKENLSFRGGEAYTLSPLAGGKYLIKPSAPLEQNKVVFIDVKTQDGRTVSFAFQTKRDFTVLGSLPENMSSYVPVDTGIEIYFSYPDVKNIQKYFEISPKVDGRFETNGYTTVFIPKNLEAGTLYTVTIKKGLTAANGAVSLESDYTFSFETSPDKGSTADPFQGYLYIQNQWNEFGTAEKPAISFDMYLRERLDTADVNLKLFRFATLDEFIKAIRQKEKAPSWAPFAQSKSHIDTSSMEKVLDFTQTFNLQTYQPRYILFPELVKEGYYLVELSTEELSSQAFLQISDISAYSISDKDSTLFWLNNIKTGQPVAGAEIFDYNASRGYKTVQSGLAQIPKAEKKGNGENMTLDLFRVTTSDGKVSLINAGYSYDTIYTDFYYPTDQGLYWRYIQTDRTLYKPSDTVEFWGFIKSRIDNTTPSEVTVELAGGGYYFPMRSNLIGRFLPFMTNPLQTMTLKTQNGFYEGSLNLPALDPGSYNITVKDGDKVLSSTYFSVENYVKPQYKLEIASDKKAVFVGEKISFTIKATFFDGTPVSNVPLNYIFYGYTSSKQGQGVTDKNGILTVEYTPAYTEKMQGECYFSINASAQLPETGEISAHHSFRVFANDITFNTQGEIKNNQATVTVTVNDVVLDTLNDEDLTNDNFVGAPVQGHELDVRIAHITWEKIETGDVYDPISKVVRKTYEYREKKTYSNKVQITTDKDGKATYTFPVKASEEGYYVAEITTRDGNGRNMKNETWLYNNGVYKFPTEYEYYSLKADKESYKANEKVNVQVMKNDEIPLKDMRTLFVQARNGIQGYQTSIQPALTQTFPEAFAPNYYLNGIVFTGKSYIQTSCVIIYDYNEKKLELDIKTDKESYKPGENMTITVAVKDANGKPVAAKVNISLVDEALLKLSGQYLDPLAELYSWIGSGITGSYSNRDNGGVRDESVAVSYATGANTMKTAVAMDMAQEVSAEAPKATAAAGGSEGSVRSDFKDTALFKTLSLDENGSGTYTFKLPDNITSFSLSAAAVSNNLHAGSKIQSTKVSMPFFISDSMSMDYLTGDKPYVGLSAYGEGLLENEKITYELSIKEMADYKQTAEARAFERVNVALPAMKEGTYTLVLSARSETGKADAISRTITVYPSYRTIEAAVLQNLVPGMKPEAGKSGITTLIFTDAGRGSLINKLHSLAWDSGKRLDQKLVANSARKLLNELIKNENYAIDAIEVNPLEYRNEDGGYGILPYAGSDMTFTALITPLLKELADTNNLKMYFYNAVLSDSKVQAAALFALAELGEPVLLDLNRAAQTENLTLEEYMFLGMAYEAIGDISSATEIYQRRIAPNLEIKDPYVRVRIKNGNTDASYKQTALAAAYASRINSPDASKLYAYVENNWSKVEYVGVEKILFVMDQMKKLPDAKASFQYSMGGKTYTVDLEKGYSEVIKIPSINMGILKISNVTGNVSVLSLFTKPYTEGGKNDSGITMTRRYFNATTGEETTTFRPNDLVRVEISYKVDKTAIDNTYEISDYAPAGLKLVDNPWSYGVRDLMGCWYRQFDGQKVTFVVGKNNTFDKPLVYYARVASPGEYTAEGTVAQGSIVKSSIVTLKDTKIVIEP